MNYIKKIAKKKKKIQTIEAELSELVREFQSTCEHDFKLVRSWDDDDGYSKRECTLFRQYFCQICDKPHIETSNFNS